MCNFYMMYWVEGREKLGTERCTSVGPPVYTWDRWISKYLCPYLLSILHGYMESGFVSNINQYDKGEVVPVDALCYYFIC